GAAVERLGAARARILAAAEELTPGLCRRGAGPRDVEVRLVRSARGETMVVVHVLLDTGDAMGANAVNSLVEALGPMVAEIAGGTTCLRILSNLADRRLARAAVRIPFAALARDGMDGAQVAERTLWAYEFAAADPYRAATHNKGIMNGIDALAVATGNDWRAIEAGAHAYASRAGRYGPLTTWGIEDGRLVGSIELPMAGSTVGPVGQSHPRVRLAPRPLGGARPRRGEGDPARRARGGVRPAGARGDPGPRARGRGDGVGRRAPRRERPRGAGGRCAARGACHRGGPRARPRAARHDRPHPLPAA